MGCDMAKPTYTIRPEIWDCDLEMYRKGYPGEDVGYAVYEDGKFCDWYETKEEAREAVASAKEHC